MSSGYSFFPIVFPAVFLLSSFSGPAAGEAFSSDHSVRYERAPVSRELLDKAEALASSLRGRTGVAVELDGVLLYGHKSEEAFPMQSVYKFPQAIAVMALVDKGVLKLEETVSVHPKEILPDTWSPMRKRYPDGGNIPLRELIRYSIAESDNNACDILFRLAGGPEAVNQFLKEKGFENIHVLSTEAEMHKDSELQYRNSSTPLEMNRLFREWNAGKLLSRESTQFLKNTLEQVTTGGGRLKGKLPSVTVVAHKTGTSDREPSGLVHAINDAGVIRLPDDRNLIISVFVSDCTDDDKKIESVLAELAFLFYRELAPSQR